MLETSALPAHHIIWERHSSFTHNDHQKTDSQNEGQANFLLQMFLIFNTALATDDLKPIFNISEASTLELKGKKISYM